MKIFGRDPSLWIGLAGALVSLVGAFIVDLTPDQQGVLNAGAALLVGIIVAKVTHDGVSAAILGAFKGAVAIAVAFHWHISADKQAILYTAVAAAVAMYVRTQATAPVGPPVIPPRPQLPS